MIAMSKGKETPVFHTILRRWEVPTDAVLVVHSAITGLSQQGFRAEGMIEALINYLDKGTLLMPAMTWRTVTPSNPVFDELNTPSHTGALTEVFRTRYATSRSLHPTHSVAGYGQAAKTLLATHHIGDTPVPPTSPYALFRDYPAFILLLGVGLEMCTAIHHPEEVIAPEIYLKPIEEAEFYELHDRNGNIVKYTLRRHKKLNRDFPKFVPLLAAKNQILTGDINGVAWSIVRAGDLLREVFARLIERPNFNLA